jgi:hypothetical protein
MNYDDSVRVDFHCFSSGRSICYDNNANHRNVGAIVESCTDHRRTPIEIVESLRGIDLENLCDDN